MRGASVWVMLASLIAGAGCSRAAWLAPTPGTGDAVDAQAAMVRVQHKAAAEREAQFAEALEPGSRRTNRLARLARGDLDTYRDVGEELFGLDAPWRIDEQLPMPTAAHTRGGPPTPDATRCLACHHVGGEGGSGGFGDLAYFDANGDDVLSARRRLPRMLAGAALLERAAAGAPDRVPFGWAPGHPRSLRAMASWSIETHLGTRATDEEIDALTSFVALLPPPARQSPPRDSLVLRAATGAAHFHRVGCDSCHVESLAVEDPVLVLSGGRRIDLRRQLSPTGAPPWSVTAYTDLRVHQMGGDLVDATPRAGGEPADQVAVNDRFVTAPLWGVASRAPLLHDGRAATVAEAILAHGGEAQKARDGYVALGNDQADLLLFLATLGRPATMTWIR